jgi:hypothetical protein
MKVNKTVSKMARMTAQKTARPMVEMKAQEMDNPKA